MENRRSFLKKLGIGAAAVAVPMGAIHAVETIKESDYNKNKELNPRCIIRSRSSYGLKCKNQENWEKSKKRAQELMFTHMQRKMKYGDSYKPNVTQLDWWYAFGQNHPLDYPSNELKWEWQKTIIF